MDTGRTRSTHVTKSNMAARAELVEYRVMFASLGAVCSVLVDLLAVAANWIEDPCNRASEISCGRGAVKFRYIREIPRN